jgi:VWFA-related protein
MANRLFPALLVCLPIAAAAFQDETPVFRTTTRLVEFSLVALDRNGNPVTDLKREEVEVQEKGKRREIAFFRFDGAAEPEIRTTPLPAGLYSNRPEYTGGPPRNITAVVIDTLNTPSGDQMWMRAQVVRFLKKLSPRTRVALYHLGTRLKVLHDFTDSAESLRARLEKSGLEVQPQAAADIDSAVQEAEQLIRMFPDDPSLVEMLKNQIEIEQLYNAQVRQRQREATLRAMDILAEHLAGIPGRKNLVWIGGGISMLTITGAMGFGVHGGVQSHEQEVRGASQRLAQRNIALYVVDSRGLGSKQSAATGPPAPLPGRGRFEQQQQADTTSADPLPAAFTMASVTGGRVIQNTNDPADGMRQAEKDVAGAYTLGFYAAEDPDGKWHGLKVRIRRPGVRVVHREGFIAESGKELLTMWTPAEWHSAASNPIGSTAISVEARCELHPEKSDGTYALTMQIEPRHLFFRQGGEQMTAEVEIAVVERHATGNGAFHTHEGKLDLTAAQYAAMKPSDLRFRHAWKPQAGVGAIRVIVRDRATGRYGTLDIPLARR